MGPPGVGKGTQAARLAERVGAKHVSTGDILRGAMKEGAPLGRRARSFVEAGQLVPDDLMGDLIGDRLDRDDMRDGFILDGFPRTVAQVGILDRVLADLGVALDGVYALSAPEGEIVRRLSGRRVCPSCGEVYHVDSSPPKAQGVCDACGSALVQRTDDSEEVIRERLAVYERQTRPVLEAYRERGALVEVDGTGDPDKVAERLASEIGKS